MLQGQGNECFPTMMFIGGGSLLVRAVDYVLKRGLTIEMVCCVPDDSCLPKLRRLGVPIMETACPGLDLLPLLKRHQRGTAFSINNRTILDDTLLDAGVRFYNIHNGLVQQYRGVAEICIFAALCAGERQYGATLHRLLPRQKVDAGPVVAQQSFAIECEDGFASVLKKSLDVCQALFENHVEQILRGEHAESELAVCAAAYSYHDLQRVIATTSADRLAKACALGPYVAFFPRLAAAITSGSPGQSDLLI